MSKHPGQLLGWPVPRPALVSFCLLLSGYKEPILGLKCSRPEADHFISIQVLSLRMSGARLVCPVSFHGMQRETLLFLLNCFSYFGYLVLCLTFMWGGGTVGQFLYFVDSASLYNSLLITNLMHFFQCIYLFHFSTCFEQPSAHHQENQLYQMMYWYNWLSCWWALRCSKRVEKWNK
jgi:hypothetical protein